MKMLSTLTIAAFLVSGAAFAAADAKPTATPAASATPAEKHSGGKHCLKQADAKKLTGDEKKKFLADCKAGTKAGSN
jgi:hypothetical protein